MNKVTIEEITKGGKTKKKENKPKNIKIKDCNK
jgi:hypothetical protein